MGDVEKHILKRLINSIPENESVTVHKLTCLSGLDHRTINKYVDLIIAIQEARRVVKQPKGMRLVIRKGANYPQAISQPQRVPEILLMTNSAYGREGV